MPFISSTFNLTGAAGLRPLSVVEAGQTIIWLGANGGGSCWLAPDRVAAVVDGVHGWTWVRTAPNSWTRALPDLWANHPANRLNGAETGDWLASYQPPQQSQWKVWGQIGGHAVEWFGLLCDDMASDGTYCVSGPVTQFQRRVHWPNGQIELLPAGTELKLSPGFICYRLPGEKRIRVLTPTGQLPIALVGPEQYPGPVVRDPNQRTWLYYTTADRGHICNPYDDNAKGYWWPSGNQFYQALRLSFDIATFVWALGQGDDPPYGISQHVLGIDMVDLPIGPPEPPMPTLPTQAQLERLKAALDRERAKYPASQSHEQCWHVLNDAFYECRADGWGLSVKSDGEAIDPQGRRFSYDTAQHAPSADADNPGGTIWDCATAEFHTMRILFPFQQPHHHNPNRPWSAPVPPTVDPPDPPHPPVFDKEKAKEPSIKASAEFVSPVIGIPIPDASQGCREMWDKYPPDYLPSVQELACGATWRSGCSPVPDELINEHINKAIAETLAIRKLSGYACGPASGGGGGGSLERVRVKGLGWETASGKPWQWRGCTSFDLPYHIGKHGNAAWADYLASERFTVARIVPATVYRNPRSLAEGIAWLPKTLDALKARSLYAEVTILVDTGSVPPNYGLNADDVRAYVAEIGAILSHYTNTVCELANENGHTGNQNHVLLTDPSFLAELRALIPSNVMCSWGSHGGDQPQIDGGNYVTWHSDRGQSPETNANTMASRQNVVQVPVVDDEPLGIAEVASGSRTNDPEYAARLARAAKAKGLGGATLHLDAGLTADVAKLGSIQRDAAQRFIRELTV